MEKLIRKKLYIEVLTWAYNHTDGFTRTEMNLELGLNTKEKSWIESNFFSAVDKRPLFSPVSGPDEVYSLSDEGMQAAVDYIELREATRAGRIAIWIAVISMAIAILTGVAQVIAQLYPDKFKEILSCIF